MHFNDIPFEVIQAILSFLPRRSLASSSLVCKVWRSATLPLLYRSIRLFSLAGNSNSVGLLERSWFENHPEELVNRIVHETNDDGHEFQFSSCVRHLKAILRMNEEQLRTFGSAVAKMKNLEHLTWAVSQVNELRWYNILVQLCHELPNLRSLNLVMAQNEFILDNPDKGNNSVLGSDRDSLPSIGHLGPLVGIKKLSIGFDGLIDEEPDWNLPTTIVNLICSANNIESLTLDSEQPSLEGIVEPENWGLDDMFFALSSHHFTYLRQFCLGTHDRPVFVTSFGGLDFGLWVFIERHQLQRIILYMYGFIGRAGWDISPHDIERVMPSIRHFGGPVPMVVGLLKSNLVKQLEILDILQFERFGEIYLPQELEKIILAELPNLKRLRISTDQRENSNSTESAIRVLAIITSKTLVLEELVISTMRHPSIDSKEGLLKVLAQLPHLRWLGLTKGWLRPLNDLPGAQCLSERAKALCPGLTIVDSPEFSPSLS